MKLGDRRQFVAQPRTQKQKDAISYSFFAGPKFCDWCRQSRPRAGGAMVTTRAGRREWRCAECVGKGVRGGS